MEYNQLDPLLREGDGEGDVNDPDTGFSPYPGNINQLVFALDPYSKVYTTAMCSKFLDITEKRLSRVVFLAHLPVLELWTISVSRTRDGADVVVQGVVCSPCDAKQEIGCCLADRNTHVAALGTRNVE